MSDPIISVENLSKSYLIGHQGPREAYTSLRDTIGKHAKNFARRTADTLRGKQMLQGDSVEEFWALKDVSFEVKQGEVLGIIGRNGAGKSTLLKVFSRITEPTRGKVTLRGRVASLLEVGTGFHPELSGRENIYLNGAILGMGRKEIKAKFDEIVDFAGVEKFLDTPVKRYSSGMYVRLAFSVAAHLEPEILVVDEVLAVGDAEFQKKCMGKMKDVAGEGRTVLFVSHSMAAVRALCTKGIYLEQGVLDYESGIEDCVDHYLQKGVSGSSSAQWPRKSPDFWIKSGSIKNKEGEVSDNFRVSDTIEIHLDHESNSPPSGMQLTLNVISQRGAIVFSTEPRDTEWPLGQGSSVCEIPSRYLAPGRFSINIAIHIPGVSILQHNESALSWTVEETGSGMEKYQGIDYGSVISPCIWNKQHLAS